MDLTQPVGEARKTAFSSMKFLKLISRRLSAFNPPQMIVASFLTIILLGTICLSLRCSVEGERLSLLNALFTATSATCVTGLTVVDIGSDLTPFGQCIVLCMIQLGGLGIMTFSTFFMTMLRRRVSIRGRDVLGSTLGFLPDQHVGHLLKRIFLTVFILEGIGMVCLAAWWMRHYPFGKALYHGWFHSVSAFCNAGFSLYSDSFTRYGTDVFFNVVIMVLIILGGVGFFVLLDLKHLVVKRKQSIERISFHSKVVLTMVCVLVVIGAIFLFWVERHHILAPMSTGSSLLASLFQSVTARTAGFNTLHIGSLTNGACFLLMGLMFIGAAPGSCGGGVKVTTIGILVMMLISRLRGQEESSVFRRTISREMIGKAMVIVLSSGLVIVVMFFFLLLTEGWIEPSGTARGDFIVLFFEAISAYGTVGLSMGVTPDLTSVGKCLIIILMFIGRLGPLTMAVALTRTSFRGRFRYARGDVMVG